MGAARPRIVGAAIKTINASAETAAASIVNSRAAM